MKKFQFRLERLAKLRERTRDQKKIALAEAIQYRMRIEGQIEQIQHVREAEKSQRRDGLQSSVPSVEDAIQSQVFDGLLQRYQGQLGRQLEQVSLVVEQRRDHLREAEKGVRILEKLESKLKARYDVRIDSAERQLMDEFAQTADLRRDAPLL